MRRVSFWGTVLIVVGVLLLLSNLGLLGTIIRWSVVWPLLLILLGLWFLVGNFSPARPARVEQTGIPLQGATQAHLRLRHGAGRLTIDAGANPGDVVSGSFGGGLDYQARRTGDTLEVEMSTRIGGFRDGGAAWTWGPQVALDWSFRLSGEIPLRLDLETGASDVRMSLADLRVTQLRLKAGASSVDITLPANAGTTQASVEAGAASVSIRVPSGVAARIRAEGNLSDISVDTGRFPRLDDVYQSPDFDTAANKADIDVKASVGSVRIA